MNSSQYYIPYNSMTPALGKTFIGREETLNNLVNTDRHSIVFGYSRWGKTSCQKAALEMLAQQGQNCVYLGYSGSSLADMLQLLSPALSAELPGIWAPDTAPARAEVFFETLNKRLAESGKTLHIYFDETTDIFGKPDSIKEMRAVNQIENSRFVISYAVFPHIFADLQTHMGSRFQDTVTLLPLPPFGYFETERLIRICEDADLMRSIATEHEKKGFEVTAYELKDREAIVNMAVELTGGFPYLLQELFEVMLRRSGKTANPLEITPEKCDSAFPELYDRALPQVAHLLKTMTTVQKRVLAEVQSSPGIGKSALAQKLHDSDLSEILSAVTSLSDTGVGIISNDKGYHIRGKVFNDFIEQYRGRL